MRVQAEANIGTVVVSDRNDDRSRLQGVVEENVQGGINDRWRVRMRNYDQYIAGKIKTQVPSGFTPDHDLTDALFDWQVRVVKWALTQGRAALFEECGLGKTLQQLVWAREVAEYTGKPVLILCPLAVASQTIREAAKFGLPEIRFVESHHEITDSGVFISNYEKLEHIEESIPRLGGVVLDESSILKSFTGKTRAALTSKFSRTPFRLCCTATPSPNDFTELGQHAEFLGVCKTSEMLATWFLNDTFDTGTWRLKRHAELDFWRWVSSWAACVSKPSDIGGSDDGFDLPPLNLINEIVAVNQAAAPGSETLFVDAHTSATSIHSEMRRTSSERASRAAEIANGTKESVIVWCNTNDEADALIELIPDAVEVRGSDKTSHKESALAEFSTGKARVIITKPSIAGYGLNWQHCRKVIFVGLSYSFEDFYQAVRRSYRFGQTMPVEVHMIQADSENNVLPVLKRKMAQHETMREALKFTAARLTESHSTTTMNANIKTETGKNWTMHNGDCVRITQGIPDDSIGFSVFSPPFADLFTYSNDIQDMGNCSDLSEFMEQFDFLIEQLTRITMPGRHCAVHCCDLLSTKWKHGKIEFQDFSGTIARAFRKRGWLLHSRITIWKDPVTEMQRTKAHGLLYKTLRGDSADSRVGAPDYLLVFRKPGENTVPIEHTPKTLPLDKWQELASPVWWTVNQMRVLDYEVARGKDDEKHICPLQLDVIERALTLWSAPNDLVLSPFAGIGSEGYCSVKMGRRFVGCELKSDYFGRAVHNLKMANQDLAMDLFQSAA